jgi:hypothetical protein
MTGQLLWLCVIMGVPAMIRDIWAAVQKRRRQP